MPTKCKNCNKLQQEVDGANALFSAKEKEMNKTSNTGIRIEAIREVNGKGEKGFRVLSVTALEQKKLPSLYLDNQKKPIVYLAGDGDIGIKNHSCGISWLSPKCFYTTNEIEKVNVHIQAAGNHLMEVNAHLRKERKTWQGKVTFVDGVAVTVPDKPPKDQPIELAVKIADLWGEGKLYYRNSKGHIKPLKPLK
jgi:hypothetical protein